MLTVEPEKSRKDAYATAKKRISDGTFQRELSLQKKSTAELVLFLRAKRKFSNEKLRKVMSR